MSEKPTVYVSLNPFSKEALDMLSEKCNVRMYEEAGLVPRELLLKEVAIADALLCVLTEKVDEELLQHAPRLKVVATCSVGYDHIDVEACKRRKIAVGHTPNVLTEATAELAMGLLLCVSRRLIEGHKAILDGKCGGWTLFWMCGKGIAGSTVGILGMGRIGSSIARKINSFAPKELLYYNRKPLDAKTEHSLNAKYVSFDELISRSDFLIVSCQLSPETERLINKDVFAKMKNTSILINISRGLIIDQDDLYDALKNKEIQGAGLDVSYPEPLPPDHKLLTLDNIVILPHLGSGTTEARTRMAVLAAENILAGLENRPLPSGL